MEKSNDFIAMEAILASMGARFREVSEKANNFTKGWIVNKDGQGVGWINFSEGHFHNLRFHRSIFEFNCDELTMKIDNFLKDKEIKHLTLALSEKCREVRVLEDKLQLLERNPCIKIAEHVKKLVKKE